MGRSDMAILEFPLRKGWPIAQENLVANLRCVQAVLDEPRSTDRARLRAKRIQALVADLGEHVDKSG